MYREEILAVFSSLLEESWILRLNLERLNLERLNLEQDWTWEDSRDFADSTKEPSENFAKNQQKLAKFGEITFAPVMFDIFAQY